MAGRLFSSYDPAPFVATRAVMGTMASIHVHDDVTSAIAATASDAVFASLEKDEATFSTFRPNSAINQINRGELDIAEAPAEVAEVLDACTWLEHKSDGAFDARRPNDPTFIDPAGFVKGWATQRSTAALCSAGLAHWYVSVGGDIIVSGAPDRLAAPWNIAIADPFNDRAIRATIPLSSGAIATSGTAQRGAHIWNATNDDAASLTWASFTVIGPQLAWADAFATTGFALGPKGIDWVTQFDGYDALGIAIDGALVVSRAFL